MRRRGFLFGAGALAVPTIIGVDKVAKFFTPAPFTTADLRYRIVAGPRALIVPPGLEGQARGILSADRFRRIVEPVLREHFDGVYEQLAREYGEILTDGQRKMTAHRVASRIQRIGAARERDHAAADGRWAPGRDQGFRRGSTLDPGRA